MKLPIFKPDIFLVSPVEEILNQAAGANGKGVLVVARITEGAETEQIDLLNKILLSIQIDGIQDALLLKLTPAMRFSLSSLCKAAGCHTALLFGGEPENMGLRFRLEKYKPFTINNLRGVWADAPEVLSPSRELKTALWSCLKQLFPTV